MTLRAAILLGFSVGAVCGVFAGRDLVRTAAAIAGGRGAGMASVAFGLGRRAAALVAGLGTAAALGGLPAVGGAAAGHLAGFALRIRREAAG